MNNPYKGLKVLFSAISVPVPMALEIDALCEQHKLKRSHVLLEALALWLMDHRRAAPLYEVGLADLIGEHLARIKTLEVAKGNPVEPEI